MVNLGVVLNEANCRRFEGEKKEHGKIQRELDAANERFKEYERKDVKLREDIKHLQAKQKKLADKRTKDSAKAQACILATTVTLKNCNFVPWVCQAQACGIPIALTLSIRQCNAPGLPSPGPCSKSRY
jgi:uncharacterized protein YhaN